MPLGDLFLIHGAGRSVDDPLLVTLSSSLADVFRPHAIPMHADGNGAEGWMGILSDRLAPINESTVLLGHSLGASQILKWLTERQPAHLPKAVVALASPYWGTEDWDVEEYQIAAGSTKALSQISLLFWQGDADTVVPPSHLERYRDLFPSAEFNLLPGVGHDFDRASLGSIASRLRQIARS